MATQEILVNYNADVSKLTEQLNKVASAQDKVSDTAKETSDEVKKSTVTQEQAAKKRIELLKKEEAELKKLQADRKKAFDPLLGGKIKQSLAGVGSQITTIGASIATAFGAALSVGAIINFSKATVTAFLEAQKNAEKLKFAITQIGGESEAVFDKLIAQSKELQETTIFSDDSVQSAQAALSAFGLTGDEIERLLPKLADFATVTQKTLEEAAQAVGQGLQGMGREFKRYNIDVDGAASRTDNLNKILSGFDQFAGAAANATKTLAGQLQQATNQADELEESIGEKLAPAFVRARLAALEFAKQAVDFLINTDEAMRRLLKTIGLLPAEVVKTQTTFDEFTQAILKQVDAAKTLAEFDEIALKLRTDQTKAIAEQQKQVDALNERAENIRQKQNGNLKEAIALEEGARLLRDTNLKNEIAKLNIIEDLLTKQRAVLTGRKEEEKEASDARIAGSAKEVKALKLLGAEYSALFELLEDKQKAKFIELSIIAETDPEEFKNQVAQLALEVSDEVSIPVKLEPRLDDTKFNDGLDNVEKNIVGAFLKANEQIIAESQALLSSLLDLYSQYNNAKIEKINQDTDAQISALDRQEEAVDQNLEKRRISEKQALKDKEQIERNRAKAEEEAQKKIRAIKKREFNLNKIAALAEIAIETAKKVTEAPIPLKPYYAAFGVAQAAIVSAQVNPYKKGSKDTGNKEHLALVGEEGPELMMMQPHSKILPAPQTRTYGEAIEAMRKKQFDQYISEKYVVPALLAQREKSENIKSKTFADNISSSIVHNYSGGSERSDFLLEKISKGITIRNVQEFKEVFQYTNRSYKR